MGSSDFDVVRSKVLTLSVGLDSSDLETLPPTPFYSVDSTRSFRWEDTNLHCITAVMPLQYPEYGDNDTASQKQKDASGQHETHERVQDQQKPISPTVSDNQEARISKEEADRLYEERMEEEYAKREGGA
ncbi:hypothetical protein KEM54_001548 [Ascosphaera aggregata]|nr:hypothetical protein KEM54_001548 [Ascosphaera aggregata]